MRFDLYDDTHEEQARLNKFATERRRREERKNELTVEQVGTVIDAKKTFPWMTTGAVVALARAGASPRVIEYAAMAEARSKGEQRRTNGKKARWSEPDDVVPNKPKKKSFFDRAVGAAGDALGAAGDVVGSGAKAVGSGVSDVAGVAGDAVGAVGGALGDFELPVAGFRGGPAPGRPTQQSGVPVRDVVESTSTAVRGATRVALGAAQFPVEVLTGTARSMMAGDNIGMGFSTGYSPEGVQKVLKQTTLGSADELRREGKGFRLGSGWFPSGEAAKRQAQNARDVLMVDGKAWTFGRGAASLIVEPGSKPYGILSGLVDIVPQVVDPGALGLKAVGGARAASKALAAVPSEAALARTIAKADPKWRAEIEEAVGLVSGGRRTVVPRQVDRALYSEWGRKVSERLAKEESPYKIWLASDKKLPVDLSDQLSRIKEPGEIAAALRPKLGLDVQPKDFKGFGMQVTHSAQRQLRALNVVPNTYLPFDDPETFVRNLDNSLANAKVMGEDRRAIMDVAFDALSNGGPGARKRLLNVAADAVKRSLTSYGVDDDIARSLTAYEGELDKVRHYLTNDAGDDVNFGFLLDDAGEPVKRAQPAALIDLLNSGTFLYDPADIRKIRTLTSKLRPITSNLGFRLPHSMVNAMQQTLVKPLLPLRAAFFIRVEGEEVARSMASGTFDSVFDWMKFGASQRTDAKGGWFDLAKEADDIAERLTTEVLGGEARQAAKARLAAINDELNAGKSAFDDARIGRAWKYADFYAIEKNLHRSENWTEVSKISDPRRWVQGLADETVAMSQDPIIRRVANGGLFDGDTVADARPGLDGIKDWLRSAAGRPFLRKFEDAYPGYDYNSDAVLDEIIDKARMRVGKLGDNADLREAVATGTFNGKALASKTNKGRVASEELRERLKEWAADPRSPKMQKYEQLAQRGRIKTGDLDEFTDSFSVVLDNFYGHLYGKSSDYLSRERVFKGRYWREVEQLTPFMTAAARDKMLVSAAKAGIPKARLKRLAEAAKSPAGEADLDAADAIAKGRALDYSRSLLYDGSRKAQASDTFRAVFLYPEAWREVTGTWMKLAIENPQIPRRAQQLVQGARGSGFFYRDEATKQEMFGYPIPGPLADYLGVEFQGSAAGLSLGTSVIPGMGPVASVVANKLIPNTPSMDLIREVLFQYGEPSDLTGQVVPGWAKKMWGAAVPDVDNDRVLGNSYVEVLRQLVATGDYGTSETEKDRLLNDALPRARGITLLRGILQFFVPSAPQVRYIAETTKGDVVVALLANDLHAMQEDDYETATGKFLDKYGDDAFAYLVGKTKSNVGGQQASTDYGEWERKNNGFVNRYKMIAGYFGPQGEGYNSTVFNRQEKQGKRDRRTPEEIIDDAHSTLANWIWSQEEKKVEGRTDKAATDWKKQVKAEIQDDFPAWNPDAVPRMLPGRIRQLQRAIKDPAVQDQPITEALDIYFEKRQQAIEAAKPTGAGLFQAKRTAHLRDWLRGVASELAEDFDGFDRVWGQVLRFELREDEPDA